MSEIILSNRSLPSEQLKHHCGINTEHLQGMNCSKPNTLSKYTPYLLRQDNSLDNNGNGQQFVFDRQLLARLSAPRTAHQLTQLSLTLGEENTLAIAELTRKLQEFNLGVVGASTSVYANRLGCFAGAVQNYQQALLNYRNVRTDAAAKVVAKRKVVDAFSMLQIRFRHELNAVNSGIRAKRGTPLSSYKRATNIANSSRHVAKLNVSSQIQAHNLVRLTQHAKVLGNGLTVIDFASRIGNIRNEYQSNGEWERELFIESSSFALSAVSGIVAAKAGSAALGLLVVATPIGWVGLVVGGATVAGAAAAASIFANNAIKTNSGGWYDAIMKSIGIK